MATAKKTTAKKTTAKRTTAKKAPTKSSAVKKGPSGRRVGQPAEGTIETVAADVFAGKWGTGRDRDDALRQAGHDPIAVNKEAVKLRAAAKPIPERLPIPNNRKGSQVRTW